MLGVLLAPTLVALGYLGICLFVAARLSAPSRRPQVLSRADFGLEYRKVSIRSTDGLELAGWWVPGGHPSRAVVLVSGLEGEKSDEHVLKSAPIYAGAGYGVLMIDLRAQGDSGGGRITMGYEEVRDVRGAIYWLERRGFSPSDMGFHGLSLGGGKGFRAATR